MRIVLATLFVLAGAISLARADGYRPTCQTPTPSYAPSYATPQAPSYTPKYQPSYGSPSDHSGSNVEFISPIQPILVPATVFQFLPAYSAQAAAPVATASPAAAPMTPASATGSQAPADDWPSLGEPTKASTNPTVSTGGGIEAEALAVLTTNCARCHQSPNKKGGVTLLADGRFVGDRAKVHEVVAAGIMPPSGGLGNGDKDKIRRWLALK